jgi:hypothetical protein
VNRRSPRRLAYIAGWLLTPVVVWAASFFGGWVGALVPSLRSDDNGLFWMVGGAVLGGTAGLLVWIVLVRRMQRAYQRREESAPVTAAEDA